MSNVLNITFLNVCGLRSKLKYDVLADKLCQNDIFLLCETKTDDVDIDFIQRYFLERDFTVTLFNRSKLSNRRSGGLCVGISNKLKENVHLLELNSNNSKYIKWLTVKSGLDKDILIGVVYIPPRGSLYTTITSFEEIQQELLDVNIDNKYYVCLLGDFNAHTGALDDFVKIDRLVFKETEADEATISFLDISEHMEILDIPKSRKSKCEGRVDQYGTRLLELCKNNGLLIANGRVGIDRHTGNFTCKKSVIDYAVCSPELLSFVHKFVVDECDILCSDVHGQVSFSIKQKVQNEMSIDDTDEPINVNIVKDKKTYWDNDKSQAFNNQIKDEDVFEMLELLDNPNNIDNVCTRIKDIFSKCAEATGMCKTKKTGKKTVNNKKWFNKDCVNAKRVYNRSKNYHRRVKTVESRDRLHQDSKEFKKTVNRCKRLYLKNLANKLKTCDSKSYWNIVNSKGSKDKVKASLDELKLHFENLYSGNNVEDNDLNFDDVLQNEEANVILNGVITVEEITKALKSLKNGKSCGADGIFNEFLKNTSDKLLPLWAKLFNVVLEDGHIPTDWLIGHILPIYIKKG